MKKIIFGGSVGLFVLLAVIVYINNVHREQQYYYDLMELSRAYHHYIRSHEGELPGSFDALLEAGVLRKRDGILLGPMPVAPEIIPVFEDRPIRFAGTFKFYYGGSTWDMTIQGDRVVHARTKQEVVFVMPTSASFIVTQGEIHRGLLST
jgi:hypothetical protein